MKALFLVLIFAAFAVSGVGQTLKEVEVPLTFKKFQNIDEMITLSLGGVTGFFDARLPKGYSPFPKTFKPMFFYLSLEDVTLTGVVAYSSAEAKSYDRLWIDWNNDKKFTGNEKLVGTEVVKGKEKFIIFGPIEQTLKGRKLGFYFLVPDAHLKLHIFQIVPIGYYEGEANLNGHKFKLGLTDGNLNGVLGDKGSKTIGWGGDVLLVDFDGDGTFGVQGIGETAFFSGEVCFLTHLVQLPDGNFYQVKVAEDGRKLWLKPDESPKGKVKVACKGVTLWLRGQEGNLVVRGQDGEFSLPTGSYLTEWAVIAQPDAQGRYWRALISFYRQLFRFRVTKEKPTELPFGPPFKLVLDVKRNGKTLDFSLFLKDKGGNSVSAVFTPEMKQPKEPILVITDLKGKVIRTEKFHYG